MTRPLEEYLNSDTHLPAPPGTYNIVIGDFYGDIVESQYDICFMRLHKFLTDENQHNIFYTVSNIFSDRINHASILKDMQSIIGDVFKVQMCLNEKRVGFFFEKKFPPNLPLDLHFYALLLSTLRCIDNEYYRRIERYLSEHPTTNIETLEDIVVMHLDGRCYSSGHDLMDLLINLYEKLPSRTLAKSFINLFRNTCKLSVVKDKNFLRIIKKISSSSFDGQTDHFHHLLYAYNTYKGEQI